MKLDNNYKTFLSELLNEYKHYFPNKTSIATIGSNNPQEKDLIIFLRNDFHIDKNIIRKILSHFFKIKSQNIPDFQVFAQFTHKELTHSNSKKIHLLFYPSIDSILHWENSSFLSYLFLKGKFLSGDNSFIRDNFEIYAENRIVKAQDDFLSLIYDYLNIACKYYIYLYDPHRIASLETIASKLSYVINYTAINYLHKKKIVTYDYWKLLEIERAVLPKNLIALQKSLKYLGPEIGSLNSCFSEYFKFCDNLIMSERIS